MKITPFVRINTRISLKHKKMIKALAKKENKTEGEIFRDIISKKFDK